MKRRAELVFIEAPRGGLWRTRILNVENVIDQQTGKRNPVFVCTIREGQDGYELVTQGAHPSSRRYGWAATLDEAQRRAMTWARRRFYVAEA